MTSGPIAKYHIAPNFSIPPIEAGGVLELGSIVSSLASADEPPINADCHIRIPQIELFCGHQKGFTATKSRMASGECGVWAKAFGIEGIGGELSHALGRSAEDVYNFQGVDTTYFKPSQKYMEDSMNQEDVSDFVKGLKYKPVYMVTGLKTAKGPSVKMSQRGNSNVTVEVGLEQPGGLPIELGPKFNYSKEARQEMGFEDSTDFIIGIRVKKLMYKKHWLLQTPQQHLLSEEHNKGATMVDDDGVKKDVDQVVDLDDDTNGEAGVLEKSEVDGEQLETLWFTTGT